MNQTADNAENTPVSMPEGNRKENDMEEKKKGFFSRLVEGLNKTRENIVELEKGCVNAVLIGETFMRSENKKQMLQQLKGE